METDDLEQKKLVYLYFVNYWKTQPELVTLAVKPSSLTQTTQTL